MNITKENMFSKLRKDLQSLIDRKPSRFDFLRALLLKREFHIMLVYRLSHVFYISKLSYLATLVQRINIVCYGIEISYKIDIASGFKINHGVGTVIGDADIHSQVTVFQNVTIGVNYPELTRSNKPKGYPIIEENVIIFPGAVITGPITVGKNSIIGANAVIVSNVLPGSIVAVPKSVHLQMNETIESLFSVSQGSL